MCVFGSNNLRNNHVVITHLDVHVHVLASVVLTDSVS